ncbi:hypothetical protein BN1221_04708 [Brenneria goodwinii]|uniref:Uncharacterized protein n=1 Tax=Brenneria goodwinii TaxID=1109412 RepID=A0A0G4K2R0_9GAMM|nr:hypothetical protein BN1221_04708 [Brenneria goodwinii]
MWFAWADCGWSPFGCVSISQTQKNRLLSGYQYLTNFLFLF